MDPMVRGYAIPASARFILSDEGIKSRLSREKLERVAQIAATKPPIWCPRPEAIFLWDAVDEGSPDEETAYQNVVRCGKFIADEALNSFLKLLLRVLSPKQFARKFPDIWTHEHKGGYVEAVVTGDSTMVIKVLDVEGFSHVGPIGAGFVETALTAIGLKDLKVRDVTWTRAQPGPKDIRLDISWR